MENDARLLTGAAALRLLTSAELPGGADADAPPTRQSIWLATCAEVLAEPGALVVAIAGREDRPDAIAPFVRRAGMLPRLEQLGVRELHEPSELPHAVADALVPIAQLLASRGIPFSLPRLEEDSPVLALFRRRFGRWLVVRPAGSCPFIPLRPEADPIAALSPSLRADLRRARRRADAIGALHAEVLAPAPEELSALWEQLLQVEDSGWKGRAGSALARDRAREWFFRVYATRAAHAGMLRIARLMLGERVAAMQLAIESADRIWLLKIGYDESLRACSPGMLLMEEMLRWAVSHGIVSCELLGESAPWTRRWTKEERRCVSARAYQASGAGLLALGGDAAGFAWRLLRSGS